jgi:AcrR family transcriptional regulator
VTGTVLNVDGGYDGFSFRELAADVGVKSASVHHHFPTKAILGAGVARRYTDRFTEAVKAGPQPGTVKAWREAFRRAQPPFLLEHDHSSLFCKNLRGLVSL